MGVAIKIGRTGQRAGGGLTFNQAAQDLIALFPGLLSGAWDDNEPTGAAWQAYMANVVFGTWDDNEPTGAPTATSWPPYTLWSDAELTA